MPDSTYDLPKQIRFQGGVRRKRSLFVLGIERLIRRFLDIVISFFGLIVFAPLFILLALIIKRDSPGPVFFWGKRLGQGGKEFDILKFRTMYENQESYTGPKITGQGDQRITAVGQWLRDTKLNELPQLWNVLKGEMSLVGPRPEDPSLAEQWPADIRQEILSVYPGITSPASVVYRDEETLLSSGNLMDDYLRGILPSKLRLDTIYIRNRTLLTDLDVIFWTLIVMIPQMRRRPVPEHRLYWGPLSLFFSRYLTWFVIDYLVAFLAVGVAGVLWRTSGPLDVGWSKSFFIALALALLFSVFNSLLGLDRIFWSKARSSDALDLLLSSGLVTGSLILANQFLLPNRLLPTGMLGVSGLLAFLGFVSVRYRERILTGLATRWLSLRSGAKSIGERVLIIGAGDMGQFAAWLLRVGDLAQAFSVVGMVDDDPRKRNMQIDGHRVIGTTTNIPELVDQHDVGLILFAISRIDADTKARILNQCRQTSANLVIIPNILQILRSSFPDGNGSLKPESAHAEISSETVQNWLTAIEQALKAEDLDLAKKEIERIKAGLQVH